MPPTFVHFDSCSPSERLTNLVKNKITKPDTYCKVIEKVLHICDTVMEKSLTLEVENGEIQKKLKI